MNLIVKDTNIHYEYENINAKDTVILLHGWGQNIKMMEPIANTIRKRHNILLIDLPGFGRSAEPKEIWSIYDYVEAVRVLVEQLKITVTSIIGHSFGGKIALVYASRYHVKKLILLGSPYCGEKKPDSLKIKALKTMKKIPFMKRFENFAKKHMGSTDYKNASEKMRQILVKHVNLDVSEDAKKINCPTILIWGDEDKMVPIKRAYELEKMIVDSAVIVYEGCTHYAYLERIGQTVSIINNFLES